MRLEISIPDALADALLGRAARHKRLVNEEVVGILEATVAERRTVTARQFLAEARATGRGTPAEAVAMIRGDRDGGHRG